MSNDGGARPSVGGARTVLITEDEVAVRDIVTQVLRRTGYHVLTAATAAEAAEIAARESMTSS